MSSSNSNPEQRCEHGQTKAHRGTNWGFNEPRIDCPGPSVAVEPEQPEASDYYDSVPAGYHVVEDLDYGEYLVPNPSPIADRSPNDCTECGIDNPVWFAPSELWNRVMGGEGCKDDPGGFLCPACFIRRAESVGVRPTGWILQPERITDHTDEQWEYGYLSEHGWVVEPRGEHYALHKRVRRDPPVLVIDPARLATPLTVTIKEPGRG